METDEESTEKLVPSSPLVRKSEHKRIVVLSAFGLDPLDLSVILAMPGFEVRVQDPDDDAAQEIVSEKPSLVIALLAEGDERPFQVLERVQSELASNSPPFVAISGGEEADIERAFSAGMLDVIAYPISGSLLRVKAQRFARRDALPALAVAGYPVRQVLGRGGMGTVYLARKGGIDVALKVLDVAARRVEPEALTRYNREVAALRSLRGPNIPRFYESGRIEDCFFLAMEYVPGLTLADLGDGCPVPERRCVGIADDVACALETIHAAGLVHRDVKPANVIVPPLGEAKLVDFGLVKVVNDRSLTRGDEVMGTVPYMAPELLRGAPADARTDAFAFGMTMLEALIGRCPVEGRHFEVAMARVRGEVPNPFQFLAGRVSPGMISLMDGLVAADPQRRITVRQARERLARL
jgi:DNA-binding response OmpR family regulator